MSEIKGIMTDITIGSDPEVFIFSEEKNRIVPAVGLVGGTKHYPRPVLGRDGYFVQEDNVLGEYNIPPTTQSMGFVMAIQNGLKYLQEQLPPKHKTFIQASYRFPEKDLDTPQAQEFGCEPDFNAWTGDVNMKPNIMEDPLLRSAGGHVIVGYKNPNEDLSRAFIRELDLYLGIPSVLLDKDIARKKLYGKAGAYRVKEFGVEYRTLSNFWLAGPELIEWVWYSVHKCVQHTNMKEFRHIEFANEIQQTINCADRSMAKLLVEEYKIAIPTL